MAQKGTSVWVRYSVNGFPGNSSSTSCMTHWRQGNKLEDGLMSSGWREKYRIFHNSN